MNTAISPSATARGANVGKRSSMRRSGTATALPVSNAAMHGPSPSSVCSCSKRSAASSDAATYRGLRARRDQRDARRGDRQHVDDPDDEVIQDRLNREVGDECPCELTEQVCELPVELHLGASR